MARKMKDSGIEWIGEIPEGWRTINPKALFTQRKDKAQKGERQLTSSQQYGILYQDDYMELTGSKVVTVEKDFDILKHVEAGDFVISMRSFQGGLEYSTKSGAISSAYVMLVPNLELVYPRFYRWLLKSSVYIDALQRTTNMVRDGQAMRYSNFAQVRLFTLPLDEQKSRADFLDLECSSIDKILFKTRSSIEEYKKLKQAVITQAVTKGVRGEREMKDSGVEWIGEIPAEWSVQRIKTIFSIRNERNYLPLEQVNLISLYTDKGVVQHCDIEKTTGNKASNADGYKKVYPNDMIVNIILCWMGAIGRSNYAGVTSPAYDVYVPSSKIECKFYHYYFRTLGFSGDCYKNGRGIMAMRWRTYSDQFRSIKVVVPPLEEQKEIVGYLDAKCAEIDGLIAKKEQLAKELEGYKKSLIYEVVTGKREV
jgi:type I restriction enzyme S subunit